MKHLFTFLLFAGLSCHGQSSLILAGSPPTTTVAAETNQMFDLVIGQSLATGGGGTANGGYVGGNPASVYGNVMLARYLGRGSQNTASWGNYNTGTSLVRTNAREGIDDTAVALTSGWPGVQEQYSSLCASNGFGSNTTLLINWAQGGQSYSVLSSTNPTTQTDSTFSIVTNRFWHSIFDIVRQQAYQTTNSGLGNGLKPDSIQVCNGEADATSATFVADMLKWRSDYFSNLTNATGKTNHFATFYSQPTSQVASNASLAMLYLDENYYPDHILVGPKHWLPYCDGVHPTNIGAIMQGEMHGKAKYRYKKLGERYLSLRSTNQVRFGATNRFTYAGAVGSLVLDTNWVSNVGLTNFGFQAWAQTSSSPISISGVYLQSSNQVDVVLANDPGVAVTISYLTTGCTTNNGAGPTTGIRGCLRDSDPTIGVLSTSNLYNWAVCEKRNVETSGGLSANFVQAASATSGGDAATFSSNVTAGNTILVFATSLFSVSRTNVTSNQGDTFYALTNYTGTDGFNTTARAWICTNAVGGSTTITASGGSSSSFSSIGVAEYSGVHSTDVVIAATKASASTQSITTSRRTLIVAYIAGFSNGSSVGGTMLGISSATRTDGVGNNNRGRIADWLNLGFGFPANTYTITYSTFANDSSVILVALGI